MVTPRVSGCVHLLVIRLRFMKRPKAILEANDELEQYEMYSVEPLCDHDGDGARQHIATIYDHEEAVEMLRLWNSEDNSKITE